MVKMTARSRFEIEFISSTHVLIADVAWEQPPYEMKMVYLFQIEKKEMVVEVIIDSKFF